MGVKKNQGLKVLTNVESTGLNSFTPNYPEDFIMTT